MRLWRRGARRALVVSSLVVAIVLASGAPVQAYPTSSFQVCSWATDGPDDCGGGYLAETSGTITWFNRTAYVSGDVAEYFWDGDGAGTAYATAVFEAYAGSTKIDTQKRSADSESSIGSPRHFGFTIGDTNLAGGINRIKITVCTTVIGSPWDCGTPKNYSKPS